jgi:hypothetical protein
MNLPPEREFVRAGTGTGTEKQAGLGIEIYSEIYGEI